MESQNNSSFNQNEINNGTNMNVNSSNETLQIDKSVFEISEDKYEEANVDKKLQLGKAFALRMLATLFAGAFFAFTMSYYCAWYLGVGSVKYMIMLSLAILVVVAMWDIDFIFNGIKSSIKKNKNSK